MKHFIVSIFTTSGYMFEHQCTSASEAYEAITDASDTFGYDIDRDELMELIVDIKRGDKLSHKNGDWSIQMADGEV